MTPSDGIAQLRRAARRAGRRARAAAVFSRIALLMPLPLGYAVLVLTAVKALRLDATSQRLWWLLGIVPVLVFLVGVGRTLFARRPSWQGSIALDQFHGFHDRVTSALPRELGVTLALLLGLGVLSQLEVRHLLPLPAPPSFEPMVMSQDDID